MLRLKVEVPEGRDRTAFATLRDGSRTVATAHAVASATPALAAQHANPACDPLRPWGHPPLGRYSLLHHEPAPSRQAPEYGAHLLLFQPESGEALDAESFGRLALLAYGGPGRRRTQGGLRLTNEMLDAIVRRLSPGEEMTLDLVTLQPPAWWQFWKAPEVRPEPLSPDTPNALEAPNDERTLLEALFQKSPRPARATASEHDADGGRDTHRDTSSSASREVFQGKGGTGGGAGASGRWADEAGAGSGVDSAGRILGAAAAIGSVAAAAAILSDSEASGGDGGSGDSGPGTDTTTSTAY
jgi:uncharacterized membrane protein YgcG